VVKDDQADSWSSPPNFQKGDSVTNTKKSNEPKTLIDLLDSSKKLPEFFKITKTTYLPKIKSREMRNLLVGLYGAKNINAKFFKWTASIINAIYTNGFVTTLWLSRTSLTKMIQEDQRIKFKAKEINSITYRKFMKWIVSNGVLEMIEPPLLQDDHGIKMPGVYRLSSADTLSVISQCIASECLVKINELSHETWLNMRKDLENSRQVSKDKTRGISQERGERREETGISKSLSQFSFSQPKSDEDEGDSLENKLKYLFNSEYSVIKKEGWDE